MALQSYYNLKESKKENILKAISNSLRFKSYDSLSINDIAVSANISRGSFYNYFVDKSDAVHTLISSRLYSFRDTFYDEIVKNDGQLFVATKRIYTIIVNKLKEETYFNIMKNITYFMEFGTKVVFSEQFSNEFEKILEWMMKNSIEGKTVLNDKKRMANVLSMIINLFLYSTSHLIFENPIAIKYDDFDYKLDVIKKGIK